MSQPDPSDRFLISTRGRIAALLRRGPRTVNELAADLDLTDNAVRAHLTTLERDGLVRPAGTRPGFRKPNLTYELTPAAAELFPKPYGAVLQQLLAVLGTRMPADEVEAALRDVGRRIAAQFAGEVRATQPRERVTQAVGVLGELGGLADIEESACGLVIRGFDCPLAAAVSGHPAGCRLAETLLSELTGAPVTEQCQRGTPPRCVFEVALPQEPTKDG